MSETQDLSKIQEPKSPNSWILQIGSGASFDRFTSTLAGTVSSFQSIDVGDGILLVDKSKGNLLAFTRIYRKRSTNINSTFYFDSVVPIIPRVDHTALGVTLPAIGEALSRMDWVVFSTTTRQCLPVEFWWVRPEPFSPS